MIYSRKIHETVLLTIQDEPIKTVIIIDEIKRSRMDKIEVSELLSKKTLGPHDQGRVCRGEKNEFYI